MVHISFLWLTTPFFLLITSATKTGPKVPAIIVFGDSTVDSGNNNQIPTLLKSNFEPYGRDFPGKKSTGRFSNGRIPPDFVSEAFGLKQTVPAYLDPLYNISDFATGVCFASAGTGYDTATSDVLSVIPLWKEVEHYKDYQNKLRAYLGDEKADKIIHEALYLVSLGTNDFLENYYLLPDRRFEFTVNQYQDFLIGIARNFLKELHGLGARKLSITGLPPMGCLPLERTANFMTGHACVKEYNNVAVEFNIKLEKMVANLNKELSGIKIVVSDVYFILLQLIQTPSSYGFEAAGAACCGTGRFEMSYLCNQHSSFTCKDANKYVFWDSFHPTEKSNQIMVDYLLPKLKRELFGIE